MARWSARSAPRRCSLADWLAEILPEGRAEHAAADSLRAVFDSTSGALRGWRARLSRRCCPRTTRRSAIARLALGEWCQGFLYGLGTGVAVPEASQLPGDAAEVLRDMTEITHVDVDPADDAESNEAAYAELVEFVRVGVQLLYDQLQPMREPRVESTGNPALKDTVRNPSAGVAARAARLKAGNSEFARRRRQLARIMGRGSIAILPAAKVSHRNSDVEHPYRQDSDFYYLTGFVEPEAVAVLVPGRAAAEYILFVRDRDPLRETWDGRRAGPAGAVERFAADDAFPIADLDEILPGLMENRERIYYAMGAHPEFDQKVVGWLQALKAQAPRQGRQPPQEMIALDHVLHDMRLYKSRAETGADARSRAHRRGRAAARHAPHAAGPLRIRDRRRADA